MGWISDASASIWKVQSSAPLLAHYVNTTDYNQKIMTFTIYLGKGATGEDGQFYTSNAKTSYFVATSSGDIAFYVTARNTSSGFISTSNSVNISNIVTKNSYGFADTKQTKQYIVSFDIPIEVAPGETVNIYGTSMQGTRYPTYGVYGKMTTTKVLVMKENYRGGEVVDTAPPLSVYTEDSWAPAKRVFVYNGSEWIEAKKVYVFDGNDWKVAK